jgi:hypothetical protein
MAPQKEPLEDGEPPLALALAFMAFKVLRSRSE